MSDTRKEVFKKIHERCFQFGSCNYKETGCSDCPINVILVKAETLLDKQEQGLLIELPCKVGDEFWELNNVGGEPVIYPRISHSLGHVVYCKERLGNTTFLTRSEAEEALAKMGGSHEDTD